MLTMYPGMVNSPITELAAAIDETQTTIEVIDGTKLPDAPNLAIIGLGEDAETILYTEKTGNVLSGVTRGFQGVAKAWGQGARIARFFTEYDQRAMMQNIQENADNLAAHLNDDVTKAHVPPGLWDGINRMWVIHVATTGNDATGNGTSSHPFATLWKALEVAHKLPGNSFVRIRIASGTYDCGGLEYRISRPCLIEGAGISSTLLDNVKSIVCSSSIGYIVGITVKSAPAISAAFFGLIACEFGHLVVIDCEAYRNGGDYTNGTGILANRAVVICRNVKCFDFNQSGSTGFYANHSGILVVGYECATSNCTYGAIALRGSIVEKRVTLSGNTAETYQDFAGLVRS